MFDTKQLLSGSPVRVNLRVGPVFIDKGERMFGRSLGDKS